MSAEKVSPGAGGGDDGASSSTTDAGTSTYMWFINEIIYSPMNLALLVIIGFLVYKIVRDRWEVGNAGPVKPPEPELPKMRRDFTIQELRHFTGKQPDGRVLVAVNGSVYDVTKGKRFYGPGGPYSTFGGRDASRNLATFSVEANDKDEYDDLGDLNPIEMDSVREWEMQFKEKYEFVGKLLRKGESPTNYEDEEEDTVADAKTAETAAAAGGAAAETGAGAGVDAPIAAAAVDSVRKRIGKGEEEKDEVSAPAAAADRLATSSNEEVK